MQANPDKFQFMIFFKKNVDIQSITLNVDTVIPTETHIKALGVLIDSKLSFSEHTSHLCSKAARQLNALARISRFLKPDSRKIIYNCFIRSNFEYCPLAWHFCGVTNNKKIEKIHERALRILYNDTSSSYDDLIDNGNTTTMLASRLRGIVVHVFKCINDLNPACLNDMYEIKEIPYGMRKSKKLVQPKTITTTFGLRSLSYVGAKLWNELPFDVDSGIDLDIFQFRNMLKSLKAPVCDDPQGHYV